MIYESTITYNAIKEKGMEVTYKEQYVLENQETFTDVEEKINKTIDYNDIDIVAIKRSNIKEIANKRSDNEEKLWIATVQETYLNDAGEEKYMKYNILFYAKTFDGAKTFITEYISQGYGMMLVGIKLTKFVDVI